MPDPAPDRGWKITSAAIVIAIAGGVCWYVDRRSAPPAPPTVKLPYEAPPSK